MPRKTTPTFVHEMPLRIDRKQRHALVKRFEVMHFPYNVVLQEMLRKIDAMRADERWQKACKMPRATDAQRIARGSAFSKLRSDYGFSEYEAHEIVARHLRASKNLIDLIDSHIAQTLATRAFDACKQYLFGARGRPRFKRHGTIASVQGKGPTSSLNWKNGRVVWGGRRRDRRLTLRPVFDQKDAAGVQAHALASRVKFVRIIRRVMNGEDRFFVQLACEGVPKQRFAVRKAEAAIDLGPSTAAIVSHEKAEMVSFLPKMKEDLKAKRLLERGLDRSRRATNPDCFNENGTWKKGVRQTVFSKRYRALQAQIREQERRMAERRDRAHGALTNRVLRQFGTTIKAEKLSYKGWQKRWGRRMKATAPGTFIEKLRRKAENAGGALIEFNARTHKLSQRDHTTGDFVKKPLSLRWHEMRDGSGQVVQRDLYSAWLALFVQDDDWDAFRADEAWAAAYPLLARAASRSEKTASGTPSMSPRRLDGDRAVRTRKQSAQSSRAPGPKGPGDEASATL